MRHKSIIRTACILLLFIIVTLVKPVDAATWSVNIIRVTTSMGYDGFPAVTQMSDGKIWIVWSEAIFSNLTLFYKNSSDLGTTWSDEMNLTRVLASGNNQNPSIVQAMNGTIWLAWTSDRPSIQPTYPDFNLTVSPTSLTISQGGNDTSTITVTSINNFSDTVTLSVFEAPPDVNATLDLTQVTPSPNSTAASTITASVEATATPGNYTLKVMGRSGKIIRIVDIALEITLSGGLGEGTHAHMRSLSSGSSLIEDYEIFFKTSHDNGATWSNDIQLTDDSTDDLRPSIVQLENGTIMLVWQSNRLGNHDVFYMTSNGTSWSDAKQLTTDPEPDKGPHITQAKDGRIWAVWASRRTGDYEIFCKTYNESSWSWSSDTRLTYSSTTTDSGPSILQTIDDTIWIFWTSSTTTSDNDVYYMYSSDNGDIWSESIQFTTDNNEDMWPAITQTRDTKIWVAWTSNRGDQPDGNWDIYYKTSLAGDVNEDGEVGILDLSIVGMAYGTREGKPGYNPDADINKDGIVDLRDLSIVCFYYGET